MKITKLKIPGNLVSRGYNVYLIILKNKKPKLYVGSTHARSALERIGRHFGLTRNSTENVIAKILNYNDKIIESHEYEIRIYNIKSYADRKGKNNWRLIIEAIEKELINCLRKKTDFVILNKKVGFRNKLTKPQTAMVDKYLKDILKNLKGIISNRAG